MNAVWTPDTVEQIIGKKKEKIPFPQMLRETLLRRPELTPNRVRQMLERVEANTIASAIVRNSEKI